MPGSAATADSQSARRRWLGALARRRALSVSLLLFCLALPPLLLASWGFGRALAASETGKLDLRIAGALDTVESTVRTRADDAGTRANTLARSPALQHALQVHDLVALRRIVAANPGVEIVLPGGRTTVGSLPPPPREARRVDVVAGAAPLGSVVVAASFRPVAGDHSGILIVVTRNGRAVAGLRPGTPLPATTRAANLRVGGRAYRAAAVAVPGGHLVGLADRAAADASVRRGQERIVLAVVVSLLALSLALGLLLRARRRRASRLRSAGALSLVESLLGAVHDPDAMLAVVLQSAVAVTGAAGGMLSWRGESVRHGAAPEGRTPLEIPLVDLQGSPAGRLTLVPAGESFDRDATALVGTVIDRGIAALEAVQRQRLVQRQALTDELTGLANRRGFRQALEVEVARATRSGTPLSLVFADLDNFKRINDEHGHHRGDEVLQTFARMLVERVRTTDVAGRLGGDEFVVLLPDTACSGAVALAENLRSALRGEADAPSLLGATASFGVAAFPVGGSGDDLLRAADEALYEAKRAGRDRVVVAADAVG